MKNYKKILSFTMALIMALSASAVSMIAGAAGTQAGTVAFSEDFGDTSQSKPEVGSNILTNWNNWVNRDYYTGSNPTIITADTIQKDGDNYVAEIKRKGHTSISDIKSQFIRHAVSISDEAEVAKISFKMRRTDANAKSLSLVFAGADGSTKGGFYLISDTYSTSSSINSSRILTWGTNGANGSTVVTNRKDQNPNAQTFYTVNQWYDFDIILNKNAETVSISVDGTMILPSDKTSWSANSITGMPYYIDFGMHYYAYNDGSSNARGSVSDYTKDAAYQLDDIVVTGYTAEDLAAMAEQEVDAALAKLSDVTAIKTAENLTLPTASDLGTTAEVTWTSDNTSVISNNGTVTKAQTAQTTKLVATVSSGSVTKTKVFDVTVLPLNVYFYEGFNSVTTLSGNKLEGYNNWAGGTEYAGYTVDSVFTSQKETENNYYGSLLREKSLAITGGYQSRVWELKKAVSAQAAEENGGQSVSFRLKRDANSATISTVLYGPKINTSADSSAIDFRTNYHSVTIGGNSYYYPEAIMNDWLNVELIYKNGGVVLYVNGASLTNAAGTAMSPITTTWNPVTKIGFYPARAAAAIDGNNPTTFMLDDVCIKTLSADYLSCVSAGDSLFFANPIVSDLDITDKVNGTTITLTSSNTSVITNNGNVIRPDAEGLTPVTLTVRVEKGNESITQTYNVNVAPMYLTKITNLYIDDNFKLDTIYITNYAVLEKAVAFAAVYTKNSAGAYALKGVQKADDITYITAKGSQKIGFSENNLTVGEDDIIKIFLWDDAESLIPIAKAFSYKNSAEDDE